MRKNKKYTKEEIFHSNGIWQESGLSQSKFCSRENIAEATFSYWLKKYRTEKCPSKSVRKNAANTFIPVKIKKPVEHKEQIDINRIEINYPNGVQLNCPINMYVQQIRTLINFQ